MQQALRLSKTFKRTPNERSRVTSHKSSHKTSRKTSRKDSRNTSRKDSRKVNRKASRKASRRKSSCESLTGQSVPRAPQISRPVERYSVTDSELLKSLVEAEQALRRFNSQQQSKQERQMVAGRRDEATPLGKRLLTLERQIDHLASLEKRSSQRK